jgi:hypothetical protein
MFRVLRFLKNLLLWQKRITANRRVQVRDGFRLEIDNSGPARYITYFEDGREINVLTDFTALNEVTLYTDSLRKWSVPYGEELSSFDYQRVFNRVLQYLSCWGEVTLDESKLSDSEDLRRSLADQRIDFVEHESGIISYSVDAERFRDELTGKK